ncbi:hypothetical protein JW756_00630 [Candidatus Woesearchaeota archaeon]|nr:hypothetical protein [Candidatus Woesearchaeota archaeon]
MAFWANLDPIIRKAGRLGPDADIDLQIVAEREGAENVRMLLKDSIRTVKTMKHLEKEIKKLDKLIAWSTEKKKKIEAKYDAKIVAAKEHWKFKREKRLKAAKYRKMARISALTYKKMRRTLLRMSYAPLLNERFKRLNAQIERELKNLSSGVRQEYRAELIKEKS